MSAARVPQGAVVTVAHVIGYVRLVAYVVPVILAAGAVAQEKRDPYAQAADRVLAADAAALKALAKRDEPDPWRVADELCFRGEHDRADEFAKAAARKGVAKLADYVRALRGRAYPAVARRAVAAAAAAWPDYVRVWKEIGALEVTGRGVAEIRVLSMRGHALGGLRRYRESIAQHLRAADAAGRLGWLQQAQDSLHMAAVISYRRGDLAGALRAWQHQITVLEQFDRAKVLAGALNNAGIACRRLGRYDDAFRLLERSLVLKRKLGNRTGVARTLANIGNIHHSLGDNRRAIAYHLRSLQTMRNSGDIEGRFTALKSISIAHRLLGDYQQSLRYADEALAIGREHPEKSRLIEAHGNFAVIYKHLGQFERALAHQHKALALANEDTDPGAVSRLCVNLGNIQARLGRYEEARRAFERARDIEAQRADPLAAAVVLTNLGTLYARTGRLDRAAAVLDEAYGKRASRPGGVAANRIARGMVHLMSGEPREALACLREALELSRANGERASEALALQNLAKVLLAQQRHAEAAAHARDAIDTMRTLVRGLSDELGTTARDRWFHLFEIGLQAAAGLEDPDAFSYFMEAGRAGSLLESLGGRESLQAAALDAKLLRAESVARRAESLALTRYRRAVRSRNRKKIHARRAQLGQARDALRLVIERIQREAKAGAALVYPAPDDLARLRSRLRAGEAMVSYAILEKETLALVVTRGAGRIVSLGASKRVRTALAALRLDDPAADPKRAVDALAAMVVAPLKLEATRVIVSPHGGLSYVPFALLDPSREFAYIPSGTTYGLLRAEREQRGTRVLSLGDPERAGMERLPASRTEAKAVGDVVLVGADATTARFREAIRGEQRWRAVHFACHCLVDTKRPMLSSLALSGGDLKTLDIFRLSIPADLVVLSACETGRGRIMRAEGVVGFTRAFMFAGAPRVMVSLWKVDDDATKGLMVEFYELWKTHPAATALKKAQEFVRSHEKWKHPYYWAAWQLWGLAD